MWGMKKNTCTVNLYHKLKIARKKCGMYW